MNMKKENWNYISDRNSNRKDNNNNNKKLCESEKHDLNWLLQRALFTGPHIYWAIEQNQFT